jgi:uncharacterized membrane protein YagU involved in acid resistance
MTAAMQRMHRLLPSDERYALPPREITDRIGGSPILSASETNRSAAALTNHFAFGALAGAVYAALFPNRGSGPGVIYGLAVWAASYLGWIPAAGILPDATRHPLRRNLLMLAAHVVWGATLTKSLVELEQSETEVFGRHADAPMLRMDREQHERTT